MVVMDANDEASGSRPDASGVGRLRNDDVGADRQLAEGVGRVSRLLQAIVAGTRSLLDASDFESALQDWLRMMGDAQSALSTSFYDIVVYEESGLRALRTLAEWSRSQPGTDGRMPISFASPLVIEPRGDRVLPLLARGKTVAVHLAELDGPVREAMQIQGHATTILAPIMDGDRWVGAISFDYSDRKDLNPTDEAILRTAADALASVLKRNALQERLIAEQRDRADESTRLADILQSVVRAARELVSESDFEAGINRWLATLGEKTDAARATFYDTVGRQGGSDQQIRVLAEWTRLGVSRSIPTSFAEPVIPPHDHRSEAWRAMMANQPHIYDVRTCDPDTRAFLESQGNQAVLLVPFLVSGRTWAVSFDFLTHRDFDDRTLAILQTAANSIAAEIQRRDADRARLAAERERAAAAEGAAAELTRRKELLELIVAASDRLLGAASVDEVGGSIVESGGRAMALDRMLIAQFAPPGGASAVGWYHLRHEWTSPGTPRQSDDPSTNPIDMSNYLEFLAPLRQGLPVALVTSDIADPAARAEQEATGALSQFQYPIMVDGVLWGTFGGVDCTRPRRFDEAEVATIRLMAAAIASTIKREQLTEQRIDAQKAVAQERARIAREIHDTLAQAFTGIVLQGEAARARAALGTETARLHLDRAVDLAKFGLSEARRSVLALRPLVLEQKGLSEALTDLAERVTVPGYIDVSYTASAAPPRLRADWEDTLFRVAQEALTNAMRHSASPEVVIRFQASNRKVRLEVVDAGCGFDVAVIAEHSTGSGLQALRARLEALGGTLAVVSAPGSGTTVRAEFPLRTMNSRPS
jgi:signal transduction histidine kinase